MKKFLLFTLLAIIILPAYSQKKKKDEQIIEVDDAVKLRQEFDIDDAKGTYNVIPLGEKGILVNYITDEKSKKGVNEILFKKFGTDLNLEYTESARVMDSYDLIDWEADRGTIYFLYANDRNPGTNTFLTDPYFKDFSIVSFNPETKESRTYNGLIPRKVLHLKSMKVHEGMVYLAGAIGPTDRDIKTTVCLSACLCYIPLLFYTPTFYPYLTAIDMNAHSISRKEYQMQNLGKGITQMVDMDINDSLHEVNMLIKNKYKKASKVFMKDLRKDKLSANLNLKVPQGSEIYRGRFNAINHNLRLMAGAYGPLTGMKRGHETTTQGIYVCMFENNKQVFYTAIPWTKFKNAQIAVSNTESKAIKRNKKKGKETAISMQILFHDFLVREDEILLFGETYYPHFYYVTETTTDAQGRMHTTTRAVFDGYQYTSAIVIALDKSGKMLWENGFNINGPRSFELKERFTFFETEDGGITIIYNEGNMLKSRTIYSDKVDGKIIAYKIDTKKKGDKTKDVSSEGASIDYWYDNYFVASGFQSIKNKNEKGKNKKRNVYYLNKIQIDQ
jgi:hypothetical protein